MRYKPGARGEDGLIDCWGLTRLARNELYGKPLMPSFENARYAAPGSVQSAYEDQSAKMVPCDKKEGAGVAVLRFGVCVHIALVVHGGAVLEIKRQGQKARITPWSEFVRQYPAPIWELKFYD